MNSLNVYKISTILDKLGLLFVSSGRYKWSSIFYYLLGMVNVNYVVKKEQNTPNIEIHYLFLTFRKWNPFVMLCKCFGENALKSAIWLAVERTHELDLDMNDKIMVRKYNAFKTPILK